LTRGYSSFESVFEEIYPYENPHHSVSTAIFIGKQTAIVNLRKLFKPGDFKHALITLSDFSRTDLRKQLLSEGLEPGAMDWIERGTLPQETSFSAFVVTNQGLKIYFQEYQVSSYANGIREVLVPWRVLEHLLPRRGESAISNDQARSTHPETSPDSLEPVSKIASPRGWRDAGRDEENERSLTNLQPAYRQLEEKIL